MQKLKALLLFIFLFIPHFIFGGLIAVLSNNNKVVNYEIYVKSLPKKTKKQLIVEKLNKLYKKD